MGPAGKTHSKVKEGGGIRVGDLGSISMSRSWWGDTEGGGPA